MRATGSALPRKLDSPWLVCRPQKTGIDRQLGNSPSLREARCSFLDGLFSFYEFDNLAQSVHHRFQFGDSLSSEVLWLRQSAIFFERFVPQPRDIELVV